MSLRAEIILSVYGRAGDAGCVQYRLGRVGMVSQPLGCALATVARVLDALARDNPGTGSCVSMKVSSVHVWRQLVISGRAPGCLVGRLTLGRAVFRDDVEAFTRGDGDGTS